jgi:hypothetical protein
MNSILALALMIAILSLCNLTDKTKPAENDHQGQSTSRANSSDSASDREAVTVELMKVEGIVTQASYDGDISTLASYIADDYSGTGADGKTQNKNQVLADAKQDKVTRSWKITDGKLVSHDGDSAVLTYVQSQTLRNGRTYRARVTDTFVKRDGRWLISAEQQTLIR